MNERSMQLRVGMMVLATLLVLGILVAMFGEMPKIIHGEYKLYVNFNEAPGVSKDTPVRKSGILIGRVSDVRFTEGDTKILVSVAIQERYKLHKNESCRVQANLLGDAMLEFIRSPDTKPTEELWKNGDTLKGESLFEPLKLIANIQEQFTDTINSVQSTSSDIGKASQKLTVTLSKIDDVLGDEEQGIKKAVNQANEIMESARNIIGGPEEQKKLRAAINDLPDMITNMKTTIKAVNGNLDNLEKFTEPLGQRGETLFANLDNIADKLSEFSDKLNRSEGTIGMMINDPELYQHMNRAAKNLEDLSRQLRPIIDDARVFSDKIARHPEMLGVKGVMQKGAGIK